MTQSVHRNAFTYAYPGEPREILSDESDQIRFGTIVIGIGVRSLHSRKTCCVRAGQAPCPRIALRPVEWECQRRR